MNNLRNGIRALVLVLLAFPAVASAYLPLIPTWQNPALSAVYAFGDHIIANGTWQLPPGWLGVIYVYSDGLQKTDIGTGLNTFALPSNAAGLATSTGVFSFDIGSQADGPHDMYVRFFGGAECAVNTALIGQGVLLPPGSPTCPITADNLAPTWVLPTRTYTVGLPPFPRFVITPATDPAMNFLNTVFGVPSIRTFTIQNTGNQRLTGSISGLSGEFSASPVGYTLNPGETKFVNITFAPPTSPASFAQTISFSCVETAGTAGCEGGPSATPVFQFRNLVGNSVDSAIPPQLTVSLASINYGTVNLNVAIPDRTVTVRNTGGGILNGAVTFTSSEYSCVGPCSYSLNAGQSSSIIIRYVPTIAGPSNETASFSQPVGGPATVSLRSNVNDLPILQTFTLGSISFTPPLLNVGTCATRNQSIRNIGSGFLSGTVSIPIQTNAAIKPPGFSCFANCSYTNLTNNGVWHTITLRFCPVDANPASETVVFSNTVNPPANGSTLLVGQGNEVPVASASSWTLNFGNVVVGQTSTRSTTITNIGLGVLNGAVGALPAGYTCSPCAYSIPASGSVTIFFTFAPVAPITYNGSVPLSGIGTPITLIGSGVASIFRMSYSGDPLSTCPGVTCLPPSPKSYNVGQTTFGGDPTVQNKKFFLYVRNSGNGGTLSYAFPDTSHFVCISAPATCAGTLAFGTTRIVQYEFRPSAAGIVNESLVVTYNDGAPGSVTLDLTGESLSAPYLSVAPTVNIPLGGVVVGDTATATLYVKNLGVGQLVGNMVLTGIGGAAPTLGLTNHWTFDNANINWATHVATDIVGGNSGRLPGPISSTGKINEALNFTANGGITVPNVSGLVLGNAPHTMAAWIKVNALPSNRAWIALLGNPAGGANHWLINSAGATQFGSWGGSGQVQPSLPVGTWVHVATTFDGSTLRSYVNGVLSQSVAAAFNITGAPLRLGLDVLGEQDFNGQLDDFRVYNSALSAGDIAQIFTGTYLTPTNLVGLWSMDDASVSWNQLKVFDSSSKLNNGVLTNAPVSVTGKLGQALQFSGAKSDMITTSVSVNNPQNFTLSAWFKTSTASGRKIIGFENTKTDTSSSYDRMLWVGTDGKVYFGVYSGGVRTISSLATVNDGAWHHAVGAHDSSGNTLLYVDGILQGSLTSSAEVYSGYWRIGGYRATGWPAGSDGYFIGSIDDVRIYNRKLSASEATDLYGSGVSADLGKFTCVSGCIFSLPPTLPGDPAHEVKIEFKPTDAASSIVFPLFTSNGGIIGYPAAPYPSITGTGILYPIISVAPPSSGFPDTNQGLTSRRDITITNTGFGNLSGSVSPVKTPGLNFYCVIGCNFNIAGGDSALATIEFSPQTVGSLNGTITLTSNATNPPQPVLVDVFGEGILEPILDLRGADTNFGRVIVNKFKEKTFTISNSGTANLGSGTIVVTGPFTCVSPVNIITGLCDYSISAGGSMTMTIRFSPLTSGPWAGTVSLSGVPAARFNVTGIGVIPEIRIMEK